MKKLWDKGKTGLNPIVEHFETKDDLWCDQKLVVADVYGSVAQARMLKKIGILSEEELSLAKKGLSEILKLNEAGKFQLIQGDEDIHTKIEAYLTKKYGTVGKKIHTGRSRNDQVVTATRIYTKMELLVIWEYVLNTITAFLSFAKQYEFVPMPGYTHMQKAMPSSVGMWAETFVQTLLDDLIPLKAAYEINDSSPLGSAAGFGVPLQIDREYTAKLMGFLDVQISTIAASNSRGKLKATVIAALINIMYDLSKFASDVLLFTTSEFNYFSVARDLCTGSSIMPQKKNVDVAEILRSKMYVLIGDYVTTTSIGTGVISGYNRDTQETKKPFFEAVETAKESLQVATILINGITPNKKVLEKAMTPEIFATHKALEMAVKGVAFRDAYKTVGQDSFGYAVGNIQAELRKSTHIGGTGNLGLSELEKKLDEQKNIFQKQKSTFEKTLSDLLE